MKTRRLLKESLLLLFFTSSAFGQSWLDTIDDSLFVESPDKYLRVDFSGLFDLEGYYIDQRPLGLIYGGEDDLLNPRLSLFLDARAGTHFYSFVQARIDRGFDPLARVRYARFDEY